MQKEKLHNKSENEKLKCPRCGAWCSGKQKRTWAEWAATLNTYKPGWNGEPHLLTTLALAPHIDSLKHTNTKLAQHNTGNPTGLLHCVWAQENTFSQVTEAKSCPGSRKETKGAKLILCWFWALTELTQLLTVAYLENGLLPGSSW